MVRGGSTQVQMSRSSRYPSRNGFDQLLRSTDTAWNDVPERQLSELLHWHRAAHALPHLDAVLQIGKQGADDLRQRRAEVERLVGVRVVTPNAKRRFADAEVARRRGAASHRSMPTCAPSRSQKSSSRKWSSSRDEHANSPAAGCRRRTP